MEKEKVLLPSLKDLEEIIGGVVEQKLREFKSEPPPKEIRDEYLTRRECCKMYKISLSTLGNRTKDGTLIAYSIGGRILYKVTDLENSLQQVQSSTYRRRVRL